MAYEPDGARLRAFGASNAPLRALIGPAFAGRKTCCVNDILARARRKEFAAQKRWRWAVIGAARGELERQVVPVVRPWTEAGGGGEWSRDKGLKWAAMYRLPGDKTPRVVELEFLGLDDAGDRRRLAAGGYTGCWLVDARHLAESVLDDARGLAGTFPSPLDGGCAWHGVIASSRMPTPGHWLVQREDLMLFRQPGGRAVDAENRRVLAARGFSYDELARGRHQDWVRVNIDAELGASASELAAEQDRAAIRGSLKRFVGIAMADLTPAAHHELLIGKLQRLADPADPLKRLMFFLPPGAAKSTYGSVLFPPWYMGNHPQNSVIAASHSKELAERFGRRVRNIVGSAAFKDIYGFGLSADSGAAGRWETAKGGEYYAVGVDASVTGRRADLVIIDDPVKGRAEADSLTVREHTWSWFKSDLWTRLKPGGAILYIGTRWHDDDLAGRLLMDAEAGGEQWEVVSVPAEAIPGHDDPLGRAPGEPLWPEWFTPEMLANAKRDARNWSALWQQEPMPESGEYFQSNWIRWYDHAPPREELVTYGASDCAVTAAGGDFTVHLVAGIDPHDDLYVLDLWRGQASPDIWVERQLDLMELWRTLDWAEERGQIGRGVGPFLSKRQMERRVYCHRRAFPATGDKSVRAQSIRGRMAMGKVYFPRRAPWIATFVNELLRFPAGSHDDQIDAFGLLGQMLDRLVRGSRPAPKKEPIRCMDQMTFDEAMALAAPGGRYGRPLELGGASRRIQ